MTGDRIPWRSGLRLGRQPVEAWRGQVSSVRGAWSSAIFAGRGIAGWGPVRLREWGGQTVPGDRPARVLSDRRYGAVVYALAGRLPGNPDSPGRAGHPLAEGAQVKSPRRPPR